MRFPFRTLGRRMRESVAASTAPQLQRGDVREATLDTKARAKSAVIKRKNQDGSTTYKFPIPDKAHAQAALSRINQSDLSPAEKVTVRKAAYKMLGAKTDTSGKPVREAAQTGDCEMCEGTGDWAGNGDCPLCDGNGTMLPANAVDLSDITSSDAFDDAGEDDNEGDAPAESKGSSSGMGESMREAVVTPTDARPVKTADGLDAYDVRLIREGRGNQADNNWYTAGALREGVKTAAFEGMQAYGNHPTEDEERTRPERDVRQLVGHYERARMVEATAAQPAEVRAIFVPLAGTDYDWVRSLAEGAIRARKTTGRELAGISLFGECFGKNGTAPDGKPAYIVARLIPDSGDIVTRAGAGGGFLANRRLMESLRGLPSLIHHSKPPGGGPMLLTELKQKLADASKKMREAGTLSETDEARASVLVTEAMAEFDSLATVTIDEPAAAAADGDLAGKLRESETARETLQKERDDATAATQKYERQLLIVKALREAKVPEADQAFVLPDLERCTTEDEMKAVIKREADRTEAIAQRVRESLGGIEGAGSYTPPARTPDNDTDFLANAGIPMTPAPAAA